jgi:hypothetical protein
MTLEETDKYHMLDIILQDRAILFAKYISDNCYEKVFKGKKGWISAYDYNYIECEAKRFTIKELYKKFMIDYLCS